MASGSGGSYALGLINFTDADRQFANKPELLKVKKSAFCIQINDLKR
jgi:hypothetical protein